MPKNKKSQIQLGETIAIVIIVTFLLMVGIVFWNNIKKSDIKTMERTSQDLSIVELAKVVAELPELKCYNTNTVTKINCFDWYKLLAFNDTMNNASTRDAIFKMYSNYFLRSRITFKQVYPEEVNITIYDNNISANRALQIMIPILIEKKLDRAGTNGFGMIIVEGYYR